MVTLLCKYRNVIPFPNPAVVWRTIKNWWPQCCSHCRHGRLCSSPARLRQDVCSTPSCCTLKGSLQARLLPDRIFTSSGNRFSRWEKIPHTPSPWHGSPQRGGGRWHVTAAIPAHGSLKWPPPRAACARGARRRRRPFITAQPRDDGF